MAISNLSFSATEKLRKDLLVRNLEPYYVKNSSTQLVPKSQVGTKEFTFSEVPLINQPDLAETGRPEKTRLYGVNQYGPFGGYRNFVTLPLLVKSSNQGEFLWFNGETRKFAESEFKQQELIVTNQYGPQDGWEDGSSNLETNIVQPKIRDEYFNFVPSSYSPFNILISPNPVGTDGRLSQDSVLAQISATSLKKLFQESIAFETYQQTLGRANLLQNDPIRTLNVVTGRDSIIEPDWKITVPSTLIGRGLDFISRIAGLYSPYSIIPGDYFSQVQNRSLGNQLINTVAGLFGFPKVLPERKSSSDVFLSFTSGGQKKALFSNLRVNRYAPDYKGNFIGNLNLNAPPGNYYIGSRVSEPLDLVSPSGQIPVNEFGVEVQTNVYGPSVLGKLYEDDVNFEFGLNSIPTIEGGGVQGGFTWVSPKYKGNAGIKVGVGSEKYGQDESFTSISAQFNRSESVNYPIKKGSILDDTQRIIESQPNGGKRLQHVGNAIDQVSKVFNDGYKEITKGSRVIRYLDNNGTFKGEEYGRVFAKDIPYYDITKLQKTDGNIRKNPFSILNNTYNLNIYPTSGPESTTLGGGSVKKYMLSLENLAWRTSRRAGLTYNDLPESEKGPNGGRIMWFPPYDLNFSDSSSTGWEKNVFLGRPEPIYTYQQTERTGQISFKIVVDHPSVMNVLVNKVLSNTASSKIADEVLDSFFAGLTKFDIYELSKRYTNFSQTELAELQNLINNSSNREKIKNAVNTTLPTGGDGAGGSMSSNNSVGNQVYTPQLEKFKNTVFYFNQEIPGTTGIDYLEATENYIKQQAYVEIPEASLQQAISESRKTLTAFTESVNNLLSSNNNVKIQIKILGGSDSSEGQAVQENRIECIVSTIKTQTNNNPKITFVKDPVGATLETLISPPYNCNDENNDVSAVGPVACRRAMITDIVEIPEPNLKNPNGGVTTSQPTRLDRILGAGRGLVTNQTTTQEQGLTQEQLNKKVIRKLLSEADYFQFVRETNPFVYDSLREKLKYFHPAFHSMTPEGLNERLTFLNQCVRPGDTIPTEQPDGTLKKDARNTSFGAPPVCILRVGDFFHSKVVLDGVSFSYDDAKFDLNPEGIGVQPMIVGVTINFKFIGGQGLRGPIDELQNALSFNFYANTEMYDERATDSSTISAYNKEFIEKTEPTGENTVNTNTNVQNGGGTTIGSIIGAFEESGKTATVQYKPIFNEYVTSVKEYIEGTGNKLRNLYDAYNSGVLMLYTDTKTRQFIKGDINQFGSKIPVEIYGKSSYESKLKTLFDDLLSNIFNNDLTMLKNLTNKKFKPSDETIFKDNLVTLLKEKRVNFPNAMNQITNELSSIQLKMVRAIDKINYTLQNVDGLIDDKGVPQIYTIAEDKLSTSMETFASVMNSFYANLTNQDKYFVVTNTYKDDQSYSLPNSGFQDSPSDKRFYLVFGREILNDSDSFVQLLIAKITPENKKGWEKYVKEEINYIKNVAEKEEKKMKDYFKKYSDENKVTNFLPPNIATEESAPRETKLTLKDNPTDEEKQNLKNLYSGVNIDGDTFNGKITF